MTVPGTILTQRNVAEGYEFIILPRTSAYISGRFPTSEAQMDSAVERNTANGEPSRKSSRQHEALEKDPKVSGNVYTADHFTIKKVEQRASKKFKTRISDYTITFKGLSDISLLELNEKLYGIFGEIFNYVTEKISQHDYFRLIIQSDSLEYPISIPYIKLDDFSIEIVLDKIESTLNSNESLFLDKGLKLNIIHTEFPKPGMGKHTVQNAPNFETFLKNKRSIVTIPVASNCLGVALLLGMHVSDNPNVGRVAKYLRGLISCRVTITKLYSDSGVPIDVPCGIEELKKFQHFLKGYDIVVFDGVGNVVFNGNTGTKKVYLVMHEGHFDVIRSVTGFFSSKHFCNECLYPYQKTHICAKSCPLCHNNQCANRSSASDHISCIYCGLVCYSAKCFEAHLKDNCEDYTRCGICSKHILKKNLDNHHCGEFFCSTCKGWFGMTDHKCYMQRVKLPKTQHYRYIYFDIESMCEASGRHVANLLVCKEEDKPHIVFNGVTCVSQFVTYLLDNAKSNPRYMFIVIAHFLSGYDCYFILQQLYERCIVPKSVIIRGSKFIQISVGKNIKFLDSFNFISCSLRSLPKTFSFSTSLAKGWFPHALNTPLTQQYNGPFPLESYFEPNNMTLCDRIEFTKWYKTESEKYQTKLYCLQETMEEYCIDDVLVLETACKKFREMFFATSGVEVFANSCTIASAASVVFRHNFLKDNVLGIIGSTNPDKIRKHSKQCEQWLSYISHTKNIVIHSAIHGGEKKIGKYFVDGFCYETNTVYEFYGCYIHGCSQCFDGEFYNTFLHKRMKVLKWKTEQRQRRLASLGYNLETIWSHEWEELKKSKSSINRFLEANNLDREVLDVRSCLRGGRVSTMVAAYKIKPGEKIFYKDVNSLYPYVLKNKPMPIKFPTIITSNFKPLSDYFGMIFCKVKPPETAVLAVLPYSSMDGKLIFPLCHTCSMEGNNSPCVHEDAERCLKGVWTHFELNYALSRGYVMIEIYEVWHFDEHSTEVFKDYIDTYLKLKTEASGYPVDCCNSTDQEQFLALWRNREGITLDRNKMTKNPGIRAISKLALNSLWGKFGQNLNFAKTKYINDYSELVNFVSDPRYDVTEVELAGEQMMLVNYKLKKEAEVPAPFSNLPIACFTTSHARLHLLKLMEKVESNVLYSDTDSIFFVSKNNGNELEDSIFLGDLKNELDGDYGSNAYISEFYCTGAKSYCYKVHYDGKVTNVFKVKGFALTSENMEVLTEDVFKSLLENHTSEVKLNTFQIQRKRDVMELYSRKSSKTLKFTLTKRLLCKDLSTRCIGDKNVLSEDLF